MSAGLTFIRDYIGHVATKHAHGAIYRGHANGVWSPVPAAFRADGYGIKTRAELESWKIRARRFADRPLSDLEWLVLAQHYGVRTMLLDWTTNPLVALYFACIHNIDPRSRLATDGSVLLFAKEQFNPASNFKGWDFFQEYSGPPILIEADTMNKRSSAQDSVMTLHHVGNSQWDQSFDPRICVVPAAAKTEVLTALALIGIGSDRVFADIGVVAREFDEELAQDKRKRVSGPTTFPPDDTSGRGGGQLEKGASFAVFPPAPPDASR